MDLTKITTPFGLLDEETQKALLKASKTKCIQTFGNDGWRDVKNPYFSAAYAYRVR